MQKKTFWVSVNTITIFIMHAHFPTLFGHQAWVFVAANRQGLIRPCSSVALIITNSENQTHSKPFRLRQAAYFSIISAYFLTKSHVYPRHSAALRMLCATKTQVSAAHLPLLPLEVLRHESKGSQNISLSRLVVLGAWTVELEHTHCKRCALLMVHAGC